MTDSSENGHALKIEAEERYVRQVKARDLYARMMRTLAQTGNNALPVGYQLGEYTIKSVLGIGGFGS